LLTESGALASSGVTQTQLSTLSEEVINTMHYTSRATGSIHFVLLQVQILYAFELWWETRFLFFVHLGSIGSFINKDKVERLRYSATTTEKGAVKAANNKTLP
jgi:hypothetical protein